MELKKFAEDLQLQMKEKVEQISLNQPDLLARTSQIISSIESFVVELKKFVLKYKFHSKDEEIDFFKTVKPIFVSQLWFHKKLFRIRLFESFNDSESCLKYYQNILSSLQMYINRYDEFYHYTLSDDTLLDEKYFTRFNGSHKAFIMDDRFSTIYDNRLARILTNILIKDYILEAIQKMRSRAGTNISGTGISWTGSKTDLIELIYGLHATGVFNKASTDLKQIASYFESVFNVSLGNYYRTFQEIRIRKSGQTNFLDIMKQKLVSRINDSDY